MIATVQALVRRVSRWRTVVWNGPLGTLETPPFDAALPPWLKQLRPQRRRNGSPVSPGGGETVAALQHAGAAERFTYVSSAGGAFLEWLEGRTLPGVAALGV